MQIFLWLTMLPLCLLTAATLFAGYWWRFEQASHFRAQYAALLLIGAAAFSFSGQMAGAAIAGLAAALNLALILPAYGRLRLSSSEKTSQWRLFLINVEYSNQAYDRVIRAIGDAEADFVAVIEVNHAWKRALEALRDRYPYQEGMAHRGGWGMLLLSRVPFQASRTVGYRQKGIPYVAALVRAKGKSFRIVVTHPFAPVSKSYAQARNHQLAHLAKVVSSFAEPVLLVGDFNLSPWSPYFSRLLKAAGLKDSRHGFGLQPTWPCWNSFLRIPIDHALISPQLTVGRRQVGPPVGSDHLPVVLDFSITQ